MQSLAEELEAQGLRLCGGLRPQPEDGLPSLGGVTDLRLWMVGMAGSVFWPVFSNSPEHQDGLPHALDRWSQRVGRTLAARVGGMALFPFEGPPYWPFQRWAQRCEPVAPSMLGLLMHPAFGLWHAYRFALLLPADAPLPWVEPAEPAREPSLADACLNCTGQPCLSACPVSAFAPGRYDVSTCVSCLHGEPGRDCMALGCLARRACPEGVDWRYGEAHAAFHMRAFRDAH